MSSIHRTLWAVTLALALPVVLALTPTSSHAQDNSALPSMGGNGAGLINAQREEELGRRFLQSLRQSGRIMHDPLVQDYLTSLTYRLVPYAPLADRDLDLLVIDGPTINAFAVPGGIIGINGGLFLHARSEDQFASVLAHEIAHLSQRHFARRMQQRENSTPLTMAGMLAGIVLSAVTQSDIGVAAIAGSQAMSVQNMLRYSRTHEQEADRVGLEILAGAGLDPQGMPRMFEIMMAQNRIQGGQPLEFLSTHPLTPSRVADTWNRAQSMNTGSGGESLEYQLMRSRLQVHYARSTEDAINAFQDWSERASDSTRPTSRYGLAVALIADGQSERAIPILEELKRDGPGRITYSVTLATALDKAGRPGEAISLLRQTLDRNPGNYPTSTTLAAVLLRAGKASEAAQMYADLTSEHPDNAWLWEKRAEAEGQARDIVGVHRARAETFLLIGDMEAAEKQLREANNKVPSSSPKAEVIRQRLEHVRALRRQQENRTG